MTSDRHDRERWCVMVWGAWDFVTSVCCFVVLGMYET